jgi:hypothetical protein
MSNYTREQIDALFDGDPNFISMRYGDGETGWAIDLDEEHAVIANVPLEPGFSVKDVVKKGPPTHCSRPTVGEVVWRYYSKRTGVEYPAGDDQTAKEHYAMIFNACKSAKLVVEGIVPGRCVVSHHDDSDLKAIFRSHGLDLSRLKLRSW